MRGKPADPAALSHAAVKAAELEHCNLPLAHERTFDCVNCLCASFQCLDDRTTELTQESGSPTVHSVLDVLRMYASSGMVATAVCPGQLLVLLLTSNILRHQLSWPCQQ